MSRPGIDPTQVLSLRYSTGTGTLSKAASFAAGGAVHPQGASLVFSPSEETLGVVEYLSRDRLLAELLAERHELPEAEPETRQ